MPAGEPSESKRTLRPPPLPTKAQGGMSVEQSADIEWPAPYPAPLGGESGAAAASSPPSDVRELGARPVRHSLVPRVVSLLGLLLTAAIGLYLLIAGYHAATDAFVAPLILSPESESVLENRMNLTRLEGDRDAASARLQEATTRLAVSEMATVKLKGLRATADLALDWSSAAAARTARASTSNMRTLGTQRSLLEASVAQQKARIESVSKSYAAGVVHHDELAREEERLGRLQLELLETGRNRLEAESQLAESSLAQRELARPSAAKVPTPEMVDRHQQLTKIELELLQFEADKIAKISERQTAERDIARIDVLLTQMRSRPVVRAIEGRQNVAFVPYTQLKPVRQASRVYECKIWGVFACKHVGSVLEVIPGEVNLPDPWGTPTRGQLATLSLADASSARQKTLRIRGGR